MMVPRVFSALVAACFLGTTPGHAALLSYDEATDGDLGFLTTTFTIDMAGTNTVTGSGSRVGTSFDSDSFFLNLAPNLQIDSFGIAISNGSATGGTGTFEPFFDFFELDGTSSRLQSWGVDLSTNALSQRQTPVPTPYTFSSYRLNTGGSSFGGGVDQASWNYVLTFQTSQIAPVPLPATLPLLLVGGLGLTLLARRKRS